MIHIKNPSEIYRPKYAWMWLLLAFKAGFINSAGFLATGKFVSHVTGFGTQVGMAAGHKDWFFGAELFVIPFSFIAGAVITSAILDREYKGGETPPYHLIQALITLLIGIVILLGEGILSGDWSRFDVDANYSLQEFLIIALLCLICGLKNSLVTWTTQGKIRVTHLTGISTDFGLNLIRSLNPKQPSPKYKEEKIVNILRLLTLLSFTTGAVLSAMFFPQFGYKAFFFVMLISLSMTVMAMIDRYRQAKSFSRNKEDKIFTVSSPI